MILIIYEEATGRIQSAMRVDSTVRPPIVREGCASKQISSSEFTVLQIMESLFYPVWDGSRVVEGLPPEDVFERHREIRHEQITAVGAGRFLTNAEGEKVDFASKSMQMDYSTYALITEGQLPPEAANAGELKTMYRTMDNYLKELESYPYQTDVPLDEQIKDLYEIGKEFTDGAA